MDSKYDPCKEDFNKEKSEKANRQINITQVKANIHL